MTTATASYTTQTHSVAGAEMQLLKGGSGAPVLVLHDEVGQPGWLQFHEELARRYTVYAPSLPGFGVTGRVDWIMNIRDMATWLLWALEELELEQPNVVGFSMGGWLAAEMATQDPAKFGKLALAAPAGILPPSGEILDMFLIVAQEFISAGFYDAEACAEFAAVCPPEPSPELVEAWETAREEACRLAWRPYMHDRSLPHRLGRLKDLPTMVIWGEQDAVIPPSAGPVFQRSIAGARLAMIPQCGHRPDVERKAELVMLLNGLFG